MNTRAFFCALLALTNSSASSTTIVGLRSDTASYQFFLPRLQQKFGVEMEFKALDYPYVPNLEYELINNPDADIINLMTPSVARCDDAMWLQDLSLYPEMLSAADAHQQNIKASIFKDNKLIGLGVGAILHTIPVVQVEAYQSLGLSRDNFPTDWSGLYDQVIDRAKAGHRSFFYPAWHEGKPGLTMSFLTELWNRGGRIVEAESNRIALQEAKPIILDMLRDWRNVWLSGAVPQAVLQQSFVEFGQHYKDQGYAISVQNSKHMLSSAAQLRETGRTTTLLPRAEQSWGSSLTVMVSLTKRSSDTGKDALVRQQILLELSRGTGERIHAMVEQNLLNETLLPVYADYLRSDRFLSIMKEKLALPSDVDVLLDVYKHGSSSVTYWNATWHEEFSDLLQQVLKRYLANSDISPERVFQRLKNHLIALEQRGNF